MVITWNGEKIRASQPWNEWVAQSDNFDRCEDPDCACRSASGNRTATGISEADAICNLIQEWFDEGQLLYRSAWEVKNVSLDLYRNT